MEGKYKHDLVNGELEKTLTEYFQLKDSNKIKFFENQLNYFSVKRPFIPNSQKDPLKIFGFLQPDIAFYVIPVSDKPYGIVGESIGPSEYDKLGGSNYSIAHEAVKNIYKSKCNVYLAQKIMTQLFPLYLHLKCFLQIECVKAFLCGEKEYNDCQIKPVLDELQKRKHIEKYYDLVSKHSGCIIHPGLVIYKIEYPCDIGSIIDALYDPS